MCTITNNDETTMIIIIMAPTANAMQCTSMIDICYNYGLDNEALLNLMKSICMLFKIKGYKLHRPNTMIGSDLANSAN